MSETNKKMQLELLMEKLRHKTSHLNLTDSAKTFRMTILEKRYNNDTVEKLQYQKCLDLLQTNMKVTSLQSMLERLESISRQAGLKFTADGSGRAFFISSDMFYLEVIVEQGGSVCEVHIQHEGKSEPQTCNEIAVCLNSGNFSKFTNHLQGLCAIYQVSADKKLKAKAFAALSALELDLGSMSKLQVYRQDIATLVHKSPLGIVMQRVGGLPLTLTYFLSPYDLVNVQSPTLTMTLDKILEKNAGLSCTIGIDSANNYQLPISPLFSVTRNSDGESVPAFSPLNAVNSASLPATFVLRMRDPLVLCFSFAQQIKSITGMEVGNWDQPEYLFWSLIKTVSKGLIESSGIEDGICRALHVTLPDQQHSYFITESEDTALKCCSVSSIPFSHPSHVPQILAILRRQGLLNALLSSCIRPKSQSDSDAALTFEINSIALDHMSVTFEHPLLEQMCSVEIDLGMDPTCIRCSLFGAEDERTSSDEYATRVLQRCLSIPVTMRAILRQMQSPSSRWANGPGDPQGSFERRFQTHINGDSDSHTGSNGQYGNPSFTGGSGGGGFDGGHSPRTHNIGNSDVMMHQSMSNPHASTPKETENESFNGEMEQPGEVVSLAEDGTSANRSKGQFLPASEARSSTSTLGNADLTKYSVNSHSSDSILGITLNNSSTQFNPVRRLNNDVSLKSETVDMEVSVLEPTTENNQSVTEDADSLSSNDAVASLLNVSKNRESPSPKNKSAYPSVSITPVTSLHTSSLATAYPNINLERRPGIEIIPFSKDQSSSIPSSLTITPVGGKPAKDKSKYKDFRLKESLSAPDSDTKERDREKERERKERKRRREGEKSPSSGSGGKPTKMMSLSATLMGPPGALLKLDSSPKLSHKNNSSGSNSGSTPPANTNQSPLTSPSKSSSKSSTPSSSPKHPSSGGKPSMSALSMSALKCSTSPSSKSKKSKDRDRERSDKDRDRDKDRERDRDKDRDRDRERDKDRSRDREKKSRTPTPTSNHHSRGPPLLKTKSLDFALAVEDKSEETKEDNSFDSILALATANSEMLPSQLDLQSSIHAVTQELLSFSPPTLSDSENGKVSGSTGLPADGSMSCPSSGNPNKSPLRSRKSSLSAVIDKLRLQHNPESDVFQNSGPKYSADPASRMEQSEQGRSSFMDELMEESDSSASPKTNDVEDNMHFNRIHSGSNSPNDPFSQEDSGINETTDAHEGEFNGDSLPDKEFVKPFPPPSSRGTYGIRQHGYLSNSEADLNPNSPSVSVHIVNVPSPLALQQTRSPLANQLALVTAASGGPSPASSTSQSSPCMIDDDLMDEALVGLGK
ncbi:mediator of RNA polymerase II transcription subunit 1-like isoform X3 [Daphnia carinata]|uniref:mediator of RNA polymerase II transcription subunit 1-like isoform X3 n=1 Tax=Daphnia carinata TaxID=120202 RepID=UPI002868BCFB|nr:mediator of RNA polymerase II transcription subunit 1-like isoform X3 [Daphnia carinata]